MSTFPVNNLTVSGTANIAGATTVQNISATGTLQVAGQSSLGALSASGALTGAGFAALVAPYAPLIAPTFTGPITVNGAGGTPTVSINEPVSANGVLLKFTGNGATTPSKYLQIASGFMAWLSNSLASIMNLTDGGLLSFPQSASTVGQVVGSITALRAVKKTGNPTCFVTGYYNQGDGGGGSYWYNAGDTTSADNGGTIIVASDGGRWYLTQTRQVDVRQFGAMGDGATDDAGAIQTALLSNAQVVTASSGTYRLAAGVTVPNNVSLQGYGADTTQFIGDLALPLIMYAVGGGDWVGVKVSGILITRAAGTIPANCTGIRMTSNNSYTLQDVMCTRHAVGFCAGDGGAGTSLGIHLLRCCTGQITQYHLQIVNAVETTATEVRFGRNGGADVACQAYVNITGSQVDTVRFIACQFNQSGANATFIVSFTGYTSNANGIISLEACHSEAWGTAIFAADGTSTNIQRIKVQGCTINGTGQFYSGAAVNLISLVVTGSTLEGNVSFTLDQQVSCIVTGNLISGVSLFNQGTQAVTGNYFQSAVTLQGVSGGTTFVGNRIAGGLTNTMTGTTAVASNA